MKIIKWVILVVIAAALVFGAYQGFLLNRGLSELGKRADIQSDTLGRCEGKIADLEQVNKDMGNKLAQMNRELSELGKRADIQSDTLGRCEEKIADLEQVNEEMGVEFDHAFGVIPTFKEEGKRVEMGSIFIDNETYYLYYHRYDKGYRIGMASAPTPYGPWTKSSLVPILTTGVEGEWDDCHVAAPKVMRIGDTYYMFYCGMRTGEYPKWGTGLATASALGGPWTKYPDNPLLDDFGYLGGVIQIGGTYFMYSAYPLDATTDQGPIALATAPAITGPWTKYSGNPVIPVGQAGTWSAIGFSDSGPIYQDGVVHIFLGGCRHGVIGGGESARRSAIGHAYSSDGFSFTLSKWNPVVRPEDFGARYLGETYTLARPPLFLVHSTYITPAGISGISVNAVAAKGTEFKEVGIPMVNLASLPEGTSSTLTDCQPLYLGTAKHLALTIECTYNAAAIQGMKVHIISSPDGINFDTADLYTFDNDLVPGGVGRKTITIEPDVRFLKVLVENPDATPITNVRVTATIGS